MTEDYEDNECLYFQCECTQKDHMVEFEIEDWADGLSKDVPRRPDDIKLSVTPLLNPKRALFRRIWIAIRYIFGRPHRYHWNFDTVLISATDLEPLEKMIRRARAVAKIRKTNYDRRTRTDSRDTQD